MPARGIVQVHAGYEIADIVGGLSKGDVQVVIRRSREGVSFRLGDGTDAAGHRRGAVADGGHVSRIVLSLQAELEGPLAVSARV